MDVNLAAETTGRSYFDTKYIYTVPCPVLRPLIVTDDVDKVPIFIFSSSSPDPIANISKTVLHLTGNVIEPQSLRRDHWMKLFAYCNKVPIISCCN